MAIETNDSYFSIAHPQVYVLLAGFQDPFRGSVFLPPNFFNQTFPIIIFTNANFGCEHACYNQGNHSQKAIII